jgi:hypothetical protein
VNAAQFAIVLVLVAQAVTPSPRNVLTADRALTPAEIVAVLNASRQAIAGRTLRMSYGTSGTGPEVLMTAAGRPRLMRMSGGVMGGTVSGMVGGVVSSGSNAPPPTHTEWREDRTTIIDYTGRAARRCDGSAVAGELVIEYEHRSLINAWITTAHAETNETGVAPWTHMFRMLSGATPVTSGERKQIGGRWARAFVAPWTPSLAATAGPSQHVELTGDPLPNVAGDPVPRVMTQTLWIDTESLLPVRWETTDRGYDLVLTYEPIDIQPPAGVPPPDCIR